MQLCGQFPDKYSQKIKKKKKPTKNHTHTPKQKPHNKKTKKHMLTVSTDYIQEKQWPLHLNQKLLFTQLHEEKGIKMSEFVCSQTAIPSQLSHF